MAGRKSSPLEERFWEKVNRTDGCWLWTASKQPTGYGQFHLGGTMVYAHRLAYELVVGPIPTGPDGRGRGCRECFRIRRIGRAA